jgi:Adenovirus endoprotease
MDTATLYEIADSSNVKHIFKGVFPADRLFNTSTFPACFIANTDDSTKPGMHWTAFYFPDKYSVEYFDSFGLSPFVFPLFSSFITNKLSGKRLQFNEHNVQDKNSKMCGLHAMFFLCKRAEGLPFEYIMDIEYSENKCLNDCIVLDYISEIQKNVNDEFIIPEGLMAQGCECKRAFIY